MTAVAFGLTVVLTAVTGRSSFQIAVVAVVLSAWFGGIGPGLMSALLSAVGTSYAFLEPKYSLAVASWQDGLQLAVFLIVAVLMSTLSEARFRAEVALRARSAELEEANRELEAFSYSVSHDLRSPLRAVDGYSKILLDEHGASLPHEARRHLEFVRGTAQHLDRLVSDLLEFSRLGRQPLREQPVQVDEVAREAMDQLKPDWEGRVAAGQLAIRIGTLLPCRADRMLLRQVFTNLLHNAIKFTRPTPRATIEVGCDGAPGATVYYVRDNGAGFDMAYAEKLFGVFQRLHREKDYEGTGVGLAIVHRIISRHNGRLWAQAQPGRGATFLFTLHSSTVTGGE